MLLIWGSIAGILTLVGGWLLYNNAAQRKLGSTLVLVFSILSMNFIGLILGLIGKTVFNTWAVFVCNWVHFSRVFGSSFWFIIISRDIARLCSSWSIIWDRSSFSSRSDASIILPHSS